MFKLIFILLFGNTLKYKFIFRIFINIRFTIIIIALDILIINVIDYIKKMNQNNKVKTQSAIIVNHSSNTNVNAPEECSFIVI